MRLKLTATILFALALVAVIFPSGPRAQTGAQGASDGSESAASIIMLNVKGARARGPVPFDHAGHLGRINPDPAWPYKASPAAACAGCHHTTNENGIPQLWKCTSCHQTEGKGTGQFVNRRTDCGGGRVNCDPSGNPKNCDCDELHFERAFHDSCIGCHRASNKQTNTRRAPTTCGGCHKARYVNINEPASQANQ